MRINPEILRHFWLDFSLQRLVMMPVILFVLFAIAYSSSQNTADAISGAAAWLFFFLIFVWGSYRASSTILEEINNRTWDYQRLSSLSPWSLTFGTIVGGSLYVWYGAIMCLATFAFFVPLDNPPHSIAFIITIWCIGGVTSLAAMTLIGMQPLQSAHRSKRHNLIGLRLIAIALGALFASYIWSISTGASQEFPIHLRLETDGLIFFYGYKVVGINFFFVSLIILMLWAIFGVYRSMRNELKMRTTPIGWTAFLLFLFAYYGGLHLQPVETTGYQKAIYQFCLIGLGISFASFYLMFFSDFLNTTRYRMMSHHFAQGSLGKGWELVPRWSISFFFAVCFAILVSFLPSGSESNLMLLAASTILFMVRDVAILNYFSLAQNNKRALIATLFYLAILYILAPLLFRASTYYNESIFFPMTIVQDATYLIPIAIQAVIAVILVAYRWSGSTVKGVKLESQTP